MVNPRPDELDRTFAALADPTRRTIVATLASGPRTLSALAQPFSISLVAVSKHVGVLERAGLVTRTRLGRSQLCRLHPAALRTAAEWINNYQRFWNRQLDALADYLHEETHDQRDDHP